MSSSKYRLENLGLVIAKLLRVTNLSKKKEGYKQ